MLFASLPKELETAHLATRDHLFPTNDKKLTESLELVENQVNRSHEADHRMGKKIKAKIVKETKGTGNNLENRPSDPRIPRKKIKWSNKTPMKHR